MLLAQVSRDITPLRDALQAAIDHLESLTNAHETRVRKAR
jgi:hypothetical protein